MDKITVRLSLVLTFFLLFCFLPACFSKKIPPEAKDGLAMISEWRSRCEQNILRLKRYYKPETDKYKTAESLYINAKVKSDKWLDILMIDLQMGGKPSKLYNSSLEEAAKKTIKFVNYVEGLFPQEKAVPLTIGELIGSLTDAGIKIWETWRKAGREEKEKMITEIRSRKWPNFGDIKKEE